MGRYERFFAPYKVTDETKFRLADHDPGDTNDFRSKDHGRGQLKTDVITLSELQAKFYAQSRWALLLILQGMDAAGKDSVIKHVLSGVNPQGVQVASFKTPSAEELQHDYLWRTTRWLPERGFIGIFNRSYYEEVLIVRVHQQVLENERMPASLVTDRLWRERFEDIVAFERYLGRNGIIVRKFFLHVSKDEQKKRFLERLDDSEKNWKFSLNDVKERQYWDDYAHAYEEMIRHTSTPEAPWYVVPADHKWFTRLVVASTIVNTLDDLKLSFPVVDDKTRAELDRARAFLESES